MDGGDLDRDRDRDRFLPLPSSTSCDFPTSLIFRYLLIHQRIYSKVYQILCQFIMYVHTNYNLYVRLDFTHIIF